VLPNYYLMPDSAAQALLDHVRAGGRALFVDGPVMGMKSPAAKQLLGFARSGRYFNGDRKMVATAEAPDWIPVSDRQIDEKAERAKMEAWHRWRKDRITALVESVSQAAKAAHPDRLVTAAVFSSEASADHVSQDWPRWVHSEYLDYAIPMSYHVATDDLAEDFGWWESIDPKLARIVPAVGITKTCDTLPAGERAARIAEQVALCRSKGAHGVVMFSLEGIDDATAREVGKTVFPEPALPWRPPPRSPER
jgi:hypothetical protein